MAAVAGLDVGDVWIRDELRARLRLNAAEWIVERVQLESSTDGETRYLVHARPGDSASVQRLITRYAVESDLTLVSNELDRLDLEDVFLRLIDAKERAA